MVIVYFVIALESNSALRKSATKVKKKRNWKLMLAILCWKKKIFLKYCNTNENVQNKIPIRLTLALGFWCVTSVRSWYSFLFKTYTVTTFFIWILQIHLFLVLHEVCVLLHKFFIFNFLFYTKPGTIINSLGKV